ncbi:hypothetical protein HPB48_010726 [Haemaphysalis longicornis]|uniref:TATA box binding protein associated factor (TAF) histone-like fold domain-containing protein n=1 Tax=Haemaphysalis longicornis TaxID=44386 RepID=A0A9J6G645_HAELO|nr:hypothetical protein HPB48_010726 [Haemaphysalis longicornis]
MASKESKTVSNLSPESMKVIAESIGISNLPDEAAKELADEITYRLKVIAQVCVRFRASGRRGRAVRGLHEVCELFSPPLFKFAGGKALFERVS